MATPAERIRERKAQKRSKGDARRTLRIHDESLCEIEVGEDEHRVNDEAVAALANDSEIYQSANQLVRILCDDADDESRGIHRPAGPRIDPMLPPTIRDRLTAVARFIRPGARGPVPVHPPGWCISAIAARGQWPGIRPLDGVVSFPVLRHDGSILCEPGYDRASRLFLDWKGKPIRTPDQPTRGDAVAAAHLLKDVVCDFPFDTPVRRSAWLAALLTPLCRSMFDGPAPLFLVEANAPASGKGKLLDVLATIIFGTRMTNAPYPKNEEELRKMITACLVCGDRAVTFDNVTGLLGNGYLDAVLTSTIWRDRLLKETRMVEIPALATWFATGNNVSTGADTSRRTCRIRLESGLERPENRTGFKYPDLLAHVAGRRLELLTAALTILRSFVVAGKPDAGLSAWGSFEAWSAVVRNVIVWIGEPDPGESRMVVDRAADAFRLLLTSLEAIDEGRKGLSSAQIITACDGESDACGMLREAVDELIEKRESRRLGARLRQYKGRWFDGKSIDLAPQSHGLNRWVVVHSSDSPQIAGKSFMSFSPSENEGQKDMKDLPGNASQECIPRL